MKYLLTPLILLTTSLLSASLDDIEFRGSLENSSQYYIKAPEDKHQFNNTLLANLELSYSDDALSLHFNAKAQQDFYDFSKESKKNERSYFRLDELYGTYDFENDQIFFGKNIRFWGALEVRNITDTFNSDEIRGDLFTKDKLGSWSLAYSHYTDNGEFSAIVKLYEQSREISAYPYVYYYFPKAVSTPAGDIPLLYDSQLLSADSKYRPSIYLKYSASTDSEYPLDYAVIFENGYDSMRYYTTVTSPDFSKITSNENAYLVNKLSTYNTLVVGSTLCKLEAVYSDVIDDAEVSDYYHLGLGVEHTLSQLIGEADLGLIVEYYYFGILDDTKRDDLELFETFQNDLFLGLRYTFNEGNDASIIAGSIVDLDYSEEVYYLEYESRLWDVLKINFDYRYVNPSKEYKTAFNLIGKHERVSLKLGYHF